MTSTMLQPGRSLKSNSTKHISAQQLLTLTDTVFKFGLLRKRGKKLNIGKWPHRFVILTYDTVYVYDNETSKVPKTKFGLIGYNHVARREFKGQNWCFSVVPADDDFGAVKTFSCVGDSDRKEWMRAIKDQMYAANSISKPPQTRFSANVGDEYTSLEMLVYSPHEGIHTRENNDFDDDDGDENSNGSLDSGSGKISGGNSNTKLQSTSDDRDSSSDSSSHNYEPYDEKFLVQGPLKISNDIKKRLPKDPPPLPPLGQPNVSPNGNQNSPRPPRYSTLDTEEEDSSVYANLPVSKQSETLESMCTVADSSLERTQLVNMLQQKKECGTYLLRKSRQGDQKVIAILSPANDVKEYKIYGTVDRLTLDQKEFFGNVEDLLRHYTLVEPLPKSTQRLKQGFYKNMGR